jgi:hypothetical protein
MSDTQEKIDSLTAEKIAKTEAVNKATAELDGPDEPRVEKENAIPHIGGAVLVSYHDKHHVVRSVMAHVLAIAGGTHLSTPDGMPAITVAYPDPAADPSTLQGPSFHKGYRRETGVVHHLHPDAQAGKHHIVWGHALDDDEMPDDLLEAPKSSAANPVFDRHQPEVNTPEIQQGFHGAPALRSESDPSNDLVPSRFQGREINASEQNLDRTGNVIEPLRHETRLYDDGSSATGPAPLPLNSPDEQERLRAETRSRISAAPTPAQDSAIAAADLNAHNTAVAADQAAHTAADAEANAKTVHIE